MTGLKPLIELCGDKNLIEVQLDTCKQLVYNNIQKNALSWGCGDILQQFKGAVLTALSRQGSPMLFLKEEV